MIRFAKTIVFGTGLFLAVSFSVSAQQAPFGGNDDVAFAEKLWSALTDARMVGPDAIQATTYEGGGTGLHSVRLITLQGMVSVNDRRGLAIVKKNFRAAEGEEPPSEEDIFKTPEQFRGPITVMYQRAGYDPENQDWFWSVFLPDGNVVVNPMGMNMAGRIVGGGGMPDAPFNCIACHQAAPGDDFVFLHDAVPGN